MRQEIIVQARVAIDFDPKNKKWQHYVESLNINHKDKSFEEKQEATLRNIAETSVKCGRAQVFQGRFDTIMTPLECKFVND